MSPVPPQQTPKVVSFPDAGSRPKPKLLDRVRHVIRARHYSGRTEEAYVHWIRRYIVFHRKTHPSEMGAAEISKFLTWLAVERHVSGSTQNQALSALLFLYKDVLGIEVGRLDQVPRARLPIRVPVVLSRDEVSSVLKQLTGKIWIIVVILSGAGLRIQDCLGLRVKDVDFDRHQIVVRRGKGQKDVRTMLPVAVRDRLQAHLEEVRRQHERDLARGVGRASCRSHSIVSIRTLQRTGPGSLSFRPRGSAAINGGVHLLAFIYTSLWSRRRLRKPCAGRGSPNALVRTFSGTALRRIYWKTATTSGRSRNCSVIAMSGPQ